MKVWTCNDHDGHYPVGVASVVVAENEDAAQIALDVELMSRGLLPSYEHTYTLKPLDTTKMHVVMLCDGNY